MLPLQQPPKCVVLHLQQPPKCVVLPLQQPPKCVVLPLQQQPRCVVLPLQQPPKCVVLPLQQPPKFTPCSANALTCNGHAGQPHDELVRPKQAKEVVDKEIADCVVPLVTEVTVYVLATGQLQCFPDRVERK